MKENYEILIDDKLWVSYPKSRKGLELAIAELDDALSIGDDPVRYRIVYSSYNAIGLAQRYDVFDVEWGDIEQNGYDQSESMDGDFDSGMASAGFGADEDYGYYGD
jgi:hypothetical protein